MPLDSEQLDAACEFVARFGGETASRYRAHPHDWLKGMRALVSLLVSIPWLVVELSDSPSGRVIERRLRVRKFGIRKNCIAQGVLMIPSSESEYLRQASRLTRRQVRRAREAELVCSRLSPPERSEVLQRLTPQIAGMSAWVNTLPHRREYQWWVVRRPDGEPLAFAIVIADRTWAMVELLRSVDHPARYLLHAQIVSSLGQDQVSYLLCDAPMAFRMDANTRQLQHVLGYRVAHLSLSGAHAGPDKATAML